MKKNLIQRIFIIFVLITLILNYVVLTPIIARYGGDIPDENIEDIVNSEYISGEDINNSNIIKENNFIDTTSDNLSIGNLKINAKVALLYDNTYNKILFEKNIDDKVPNASTTKILTAIVAYENSNLEDIVTVTQKSASIGGSTIGLKKGDKIKMEDLIKGLLISSGNDAAVAIAEHIGGNVEDFMKMVNKKAKELGAKNTNFITPHGLDDDMHYTTARDLLIFSKKLLEIPFLSKIVDTRNDIININGYPKELRTTNEMLGIYEEANGIKTGFTGKAGRCLITSINKNERNLIAIVLGCDTKKQRTDETKQLIAYGYTEYEVVDIYEKMKKKFNISIAKTKSRGYEINITGTKKTVLKCGEKDSIKYKYKISNNLVAPIEKNDILGEITILLNNNEIDKIQIKSPIKIERMKTIDFLKKLLNNQEEYILVNLYYSNT